MTKAIDDFAASERTDNLNQIASDTAGIHGEMAKKHDALKSLRSEVSKLEDTVKNQERHKKMIRDNIDIIETQRTARHLNREIERLEEQKKSVEGGDTAYEEEKRAVALKNKREGELARLEGRFMEVVEAIRSLKRKLSTEEYKDVDEQFRIANIKHQTTQLAAQDIKKYWTAVDKALLKYHSVKIAVSKSCSSLFLAPSTPDMLFSLRFS